MELLLKHPNAIWNLVLAVVWAVAAVHAFAQYRSILGVVLWLSLSGAFTAVAFVDLQGLVAREWVSVATNAVTGIMGIMIGTVNLCAGSAPYFPTWINWAFIGLGVAYISSAVLVGLGYWST